MSVFNLRMRVCSSFSLSVLLDRSPFNITHSSLTIVWSGLLKCLATGSHLLFFAFFIVHAGSKDGRCFTYVVA